MAVSPDSLIMRQLANRRSKLLNALDSFPQEVNLARLLDEVDAAMERVDDGTFGQCIACQEAIEPDRLIADPLIQLCLDHLTSSQQRALEQDLALAAQIQNGLLPPKRVQDGGWEAAYHYEGAGPVSGDYCDLLRFGGDFYFTVGDVSGKGVAASMLMAHLHATFRTLVSLNLPLAQIVERTSRMFCESTLPAHFATLACGKAGSEGELEICNAGHTHPFLVRGATIERVVSTGLPLGMFCEEQFAVRKAHMNPGDTILLYTDGLSEALNEPGLEYGTERLSDIVQSHHDLPPAELISICVEDLKTYRAGTPMGDDLTIMAVRRSSL